MDERAVSGSRVPVGSSAKSMNGSFASCRARTTRLFLTARKIPGDMHHSVGESDLIDEICCPVDLFILRILDIIKCMEDVFDDPVISVQGERALEHDCSPPHQPALQSSSSFSLQRSISWLKHAAAMRAGFSRGTADIHKIAAVACSNMVYDPAACRGLLNPSHEVHQHGLSGPLLPIIPRISPSAISKEILERILVPSKSMQRLSTVISGAFMIPLYLMWYCVSYYLLYAAPHYRPHVREFIQVILRSLLLRSGALHYIPDHMSPRFVKSFRAIPLACCTVRIAISAFCIAHRSLIPSPTINT